MKPLFYWLFLCFCVLAISSCRKNADTQSVMDKAEQALDNGNIADAVKLCDKATESPDAESLSWKDFCRAATIYAVAYDHDYMTDASMASALGCLDRARALEPDSVEAYIAYLPQNKSAALYTVSHTLDGLYSDHTNISDHEDEYYDQDTDTIPD